MTCEPYLRKMEDWPSKEEEKGSTEGRQQHNNTTMAEQRTKKERRESPMLIYLSSCVPVSGVQPSLRAHCWLSLNNSRLFLNFFFGA